MENTLASHIYQPKVPAVSGTGSLVVVFFLTWLAFILALGARGAFVAAPGAPPLGLLIGLLAPLTLFLAGYWTIRPLREFILSSDLRLIVGIQAWRWAGFGFLTLYSFKVLPGIFAWPAGLGDMAIGVTAPLVLIPTYLVPTFLMLHLTALFQARRLGRETTRYGKSGASGEIRISQTA